MWWFASLGDYRQGVVINYNRPNIVQNAGLRHLPAHEEDPDGAGTMPN